MHEDEDVAPGAGYFVVRPGGFELHEWHRGGSMCPALRRCTSRRRARECRRRWRVLAAGTVRSRHDLRTTLSDA